MSIPAPDHSPTGSPLSSSRVVICGAGITGYLAAIVLHRNGFRNITLVDRLHDPAHFHRTRAYTLAIYKLGQRLLHDLPDLFRIFKQHAFEQTVRHVTTCDARARLSHTSAPLPAAPVYWLLRANFVNLLAHYVADHCPSVRLVTNCAVEDFVFDHHSFVAVKLRSAENCLTQIPADLVIACDGSNSSLLSIARNHQSKIHTSHGFNLFRRSSPSLGMCPKGIVLSSPPVVTLPDGSTATLADRTTVYTIKGNPAYKHRFDLLLLPLGNPHVKHSPIAMLCLTPAHQLWNTHSVHDAFAIFHHNFPNLNVRHLITPAEMARLIEEKPMPFCHIQRPNSIAGIFKHNRPAAAADAADAADAPPPRGIVFMGDAAHAFPPDLAQGINSALEDVRVFNLVLQQFGADRASLRTVLHNYEQRRNAEIWHLIKLMHNGAAYQYGQNRLALMAYQTNKCVRNALCAVAPHMFHPVVDTLIRQDYDYAEVRSMARKSVINTILLAMSALVVPLCGALLLKLYPVPTW